MSKEQLEEMKEVSCFACHAEILWKDPMCVHNNKSYCKDCYLQVLRKENQRYKQALKHCKDILKENREFNKGEYSSYITGIQEGLEFAIDEFEKALEGDSNE